MGMNMPAGVPQSDRHDAIVIGAGAAGMTAACVMAAEGRRVLLIDKSEQVGGTTAISGGMIWIPANHKMAAAGLHDNIQSAETYLAACVPDSNEETRLHQFLTRGDEAIIYLEKRTQVKLRPVLRYPDYYPDRAGSTAGGRVLEAEPFDASELGANFSLLAPPLPEFTLFGGMMISRENIPHFRRVGRSAYSTWRVACFIARYARERLSAPRGTTLYLGNALAGRLFLSCIRLGVSIATGVSVAIERDRKVGRWRFRCNDSQGILVRQGTCNAVVLATGGYSRDIDRREKTFPLGSGLSSATTKAATGDGIRIGLGLGGHLGTNNVSAAYWVPGSRFRRTDGTEAVFPHTVTDRAKPGMIALDRHGRRFVNEAVSYHEFVLAMLRASNGEEATAFLFCDRTALWKYGLGRIMPFSLSVRHEIDSGYLVKANDVSDLARQLGLPVETVVQTISDFNTDATSGIDTQFGRGSDIYQQHLGDAEQVPNPCVAPIVKPPFYAVRLHVADLGTTTGLDTDTHGEVLDEDGQPIAGLYACGNDMHSIMRGTYPGPGITLGPALVFGYLAGRNAARASTRK
jgi:succinate dehydrogenase/fumarate reductase flavoprotein subunit